MRAAKVTLLAAAVLTLAAPVAYGQESSQVGVSPGRQLVKEGDRQATVYVSNPGDTDIRVTAEGYYYDGSSWVQSDLLGMSFSPAAFKLRPGAQQTVRIRFAAEPEQKCKLLGAGFRSRNPHILDTGGIMVEGNVLAQLAVNGRGGVEKDCLPLLPVPDPPPAPPAPPLHIPWATIGLVGGIILAFLAGRRHRKGER